MPSDVMTTTTPTTTGSDSTTNGLHDVIEIDDIPKSVTVCLKRNVILGYSDIGGVGCRVLLGLDMRKEYFDLPLSPLVDRLQVACVRHIAPCLTEQHFSPLQVLNCKYEQFSLIVVNAEMTSSQHHVVASCIADMCVDWNTESLVVLTCLRLEDGLEVSSMYENVYNNAKPITTCPRLSSDTPIRDPFLSTVIQVLQLSGISWNLLIVPGHRKQSVYVDTRTAKQIEDLQNVISDHTRIKFDLDLSLSLIHHSRKNEALYQYCSAYK